MGRQSRIALLVIALLVVAVLIERHRAAEARRRQHEAELQAGLDASRVLSATFERAGALRAARLHGEVMSQGACTSAYLFTDQQQTVAPYSVNYMLDLSRVGRSSFRWDAAGRVMFVELPGITVEPPAIDLSRARSRQSGTFISRNCGMAMQQQVAGRLDAAAAARAQRPDYLARAGDAARAEVRDLVRAPLAAAGLGQVDVRVRLATDPRPNDEQWDRSRSLAEVLGAR